MMHFQFKKDMYGNEKFGEGATNRLLNFERIFERIFFCEIIECNTTISSKDIIEEEINYIVQ
jgi:hypothetical protein